MSLWLRKAAYADRDLLFGWANDDTVRANAFHTEKIPYEKHVIWFEKMMTDPSVYQYILYDGGTPVGQIRLNVENSEAIVGYSIAADQRGKGYGSRMLRMLQTQIGADQTAHVTKIVGLVKYGNIASARTFERCAFLRKDLPEYIQYEKKVAKGLQDSDVKGFIE